MADIPLRDLLGAFSRVVSATLSVGPALDAFVREVNAALGARRTAVWLHDRRARILSLAASSSDDPGAPTRVSAEDAEAIVARGLRLDLPLILDNPDGAVLIAPLRGWRRALGTLVIEHPALADEWRLLTQVDELARQLSVGVENVLLLEEVLRQRQRLAQSEKLASLGQFIAGIAHEMNNPLQGVLGHLELLMRTADRGLKKELRGIYQEADRAAKIVANLLVFSGSRRLTRRRLRVERIVSRALVSRRAALRKGTIDVVRADGDDLPPVSGDPLLLHQAFLNVLINAEHAATAGAPPPRIQVAVRADADRAIVVTTIRDSGAGIPADVLPRIFDPFFTTKEVGRGTGLGLAITYGIIQEHGGAIHAANDVGGGAVFTVELPVDRARVW
jgi:C4-dicarboxylate-specific signal transduction histidine kinase